MTVAGAFNLAEGTTPATPASGLVLFANSSKHASTVDTTGLVTDLVNGKIVATATPADPTGTTDTTGKMMGLAGSFTPAITGRVVMVITGNIASSASADGAAAQLTYGTGSAPANAAALTGTAAGTIAQVTAVNVNADKYPFTCLAYASLTAGTTYWFDLRLKATTAGTASVTSIYMLAVEL